MRTPSHLVSYHHTAEVKTSCDRVLPALWGTDSRGVISLFAVGPVLLLQLICRSAKSHLRLYWGLSTRIFLGDVGAKQSTFIKFISGNPSPHQAFAPSPQRRGSHGEVPTPCLGLPMNVWAKTWRAQVVGVKPFDILMGIIIVSLGLNEYPCETQILYHIFMI